MISRFFKPASDADSAPKKHRLPLPVLFALVLAALALAAAAAFGLLYLRGSARAAAQQQLADRVTALADSAAEQDEQDTEPAVEQEDGDVITVNGKKYRFNQNLITILCMGIDSRTNPGFEVQDTKWGYNGQADAIFLAVLDLSAGSMKLVGISRDTMTPIPIYGISGDRVGDSVEHLSYAWGFGDGAKVSAQSMMESVSYLFYGIPIDAYCALSFQGVPALNDAVGGVTVTMTDAAWCKANKVSLNEPYLLKGDKALSFVQARDISVEGSNNQRMARQKQYADAFVAALKQKLRTSPAIISTLYSTASPYMLTDITVDYAVYLGMKAASIRFSSSDILMVAGEDNFEHQYNEFYVDDAALRQLVLDVFYVPVS